MSEGTRLRELAKLLEQSEEHRLLAERARAQFHSAELEKARIIQDWYSSAAPLDKMSRRLREALAPLQAVRDQVAHANAVLNSDSLREHVAAVHDQMARSRDTIDAMQHSSSVRQALQATEAAMQRNAELADLYQKIEHIQRTLKALQAQHVPSAPEPVSDQVDE